MNDVVDGIEYTMNAILFPPILTDEIDQGYVEGIHRWLTQSTQRRYVGWDTNNSTEDMIITSVVTPGGQVRTPPPVNDLRITISANNAILRWTPVPFAVSYNVYKASAPSFSGIISTFNTNANVWVDRWALLSDDQAYYRIGSVGSEPLFAPHEVRNLTIERVNQSVRLSWICTSTEATFKIYRCQDPSFPEGQVELMQTNYSLYEWVDHGAIVHGPYFYRVTSVREDLGLIQ